MTPVERLVQHLGALMVLAGEQHPAHVQVMLVGGCRFLETKFYENLTQFGGREARADDRAMQVGIEFPYLSSASRRRSKDLLHAHRQFALGQLR
jgi:hypothetical protein